MSQTSTITHDDNDTMKQLNERLEKIEKSQKSMETKIDSTVSIAITKHIDEKFMPLHNALQNQMNEKNNEYETRFEKMLEAVQGIGTSYSKQLNDLTTSLESRITASVKAGITVFTTSNPPSGKIKSSHGGSQ